jgi:hypothetical protein
MQTSVIDPHLARLEQGCLKYGSRVFGRSLGTSTGKFGYLANLHGQEMLLLDVDAQSDREFAVHRDFMTAIHRNRRR